MIKRLLLCLLLLFPFEVWAACTGSSPTWTSTPDYTSVASCVSQATYDDTINISAGDGSETWSSQLAVTKGIKIIGPGSGSLTITSAYNGYLILYTPDATTLSNGNQFRLSGVTWALAGYRWVNLTNATNTGATVIIDSNVVSGMSAIPSFITNGLFYGVVYSNTFTGAAASSYVHFDMYGRDNSSDWTYLTLTYGSADNLYFEDNTFTGGDTFFSHGHGGRSVIRYNSFSYTNRTTLSPWIDIHGNQTSGVFAPLGTEIYGNELTRTETVNSVIPFDHRGGKALIYYNRVVSGSSTTSRSREEFADTISSTPVNAIDGQPQHISESYYFNNRVGSDGTTLLTFSNPNGGYGCCDTSFPSTCAIPCTSETGIAENREFFNHIVSFNGTAGVGCGSTLPGICTANSSGFWLTDQSCSASADYVGASPTTPISGTLYKCTATNTWTAYYTPYTYPHPLRGESDTTAPTATWAIDSTGLIATATFSETVNATTKTGVSFTGSVTGAITATYKDGMPGGIVRYDLNKEVQQSDTVVVDYTTPGDGIKDLAGNALADISDGAVTNGSTQNSPPLVTLTIGAHTGATVNVYPGINCGSTCGPVEYDSGSVLTLNVTTLRNYTGCTIGGTGCGASTTMSEARTCTVTCTKISPDVAIGSGAAVTLGAGAVGTLY
jgi:hypothetical protein